MRTLTCLPFTILLACNCFSQNASPKDSTLVEKSWHISLYAGIGAGIAHGNNPYHINYFSPVDLSQEFQQVNVSYGQGIYTGFHLDRLFNEHSGITFGFSFLRSFNIRYRYAYEYYYNNEVYTYETTYRDYARSYDLSISYLFLKKMNRFTLAPTFGIKVGIPVIYEYIHTIKTKSRTEEYDDYWKFSGGISVGTVASLSLIWREDRKCSFYGTLRFHAISYAPAKGRLYASYINGVSNLDSIPVMYKEIDYFWSYSEPSRSSILSEPDKALRTFQPFSAVELAFGTKFLIGRKYKPRKGKNTKASI